MSDHDIRKSEQYRAEAEAKWGGTDAYRQWAEKNYSVREQNELAGGLDRVMAEFSACMKNGEAADSPAARELVQKLQAYITEHFYDCTDRILAGLGRMYTEDGRFRSNIDRHGEGTANYIRRAVEACVGE